MWLLGPLAHILIPQPAYRWVRTRHAIEISLFLTRVQLVDYPFQLFELLPGFAKFAFRSQALVFGEVFTGLCD